MRRAAFIAILAAATMGGSCSSDSENSNQTLFLATLSPANEVPARESSASGVARITFDGTTVTFLVTANNFENYTMGHIHSGAAGVNGPVRVFLYGPSAPTSLARGDTRPELVHRERHGRGLRLQHADRGDARRHRLRELPHLALPRG